MVKIRRFNEAITDIFEYDIRNITPKYLTIISGDITDINGMLIDPKTGMSTNIPCRYKLGNIMSDAVYQITYDRDFDIDGIADTLEIDLGPIHSDGEKDFHLNVEITLGNFIAAGFNVKSPNIVDPYQYTSYHSKMDPTNTVFALTRESLEDLCRFFNHFDGIKVTPSDLKFLDSKDNFTDL
jgi:hypothetical protein